MAEAGWDAAEECWDVSLLAVVGIIIGIIALVGAAVGVLAVVTHGFRPKTGGHLGALPPRSGCGPDTNQPGASALTATVLSCAGPHYAEVFATFSLAGPRPWPGPSAVQLDVSNGCESLLDSYSEPAAGGPPY